MKNKIIKINDTRYLVEDEVPSIDGGAPQQLFLKKIEEEKELKEDKISFPQTLREAGLSVESISLSPSEIDSFWREYVIKTYKEDGEILALEIDGDGNILGPIQLSSMIPDLETLSSINVIKKRLPDGQPVKTSMTKKEITEQFILYRFFASKGKQKPPKREERNNKADIETLENFLREIYRNSDTSVKKIDFLDQLFSVIDEIIELKKKS